MDSEWKEFLLRLNKKCDDLGMPDLTEDQKSELDKMLSRRMKNTGESPEAAAEHIVRYLLGERHVEPENPETN